MKGLKVLVSVLLVLALLSFLVGCTGPEGLMGPKGGQGVQGPVGSQGMQGEPGPQGEPGAGGVKGSTGATGATGAAGATGAQGEQGEQGPAGAGARGPKGSTGPQGIQGPPGPTGDILLLSVIERAAFRLLATQNNSGSWEWTNPDTNPTTLSTSVNTLGVTAQGMLDYYKLLGSPRYLDACIIAYNQMVVNAQSELPGDKTPRRMRGPDIPFLVELSEVTGDSVYAEFAQARYSANLIEFGSLAELVRDIRIDECQALISWDINLYVQGALALHRYFPNGDYDTQAVAMAEVIYTSLYVEQVDFDLGGDTQTAYWLAVTGALEAFASTGTYPVKVTDLTSSLLAVQQLDGSFLSGLVWNETFQPTAYAIMALIKVGGYDRAVVSAVNYLVGSQEPNGGWLEGGTTENTEVGSEIAQAIYDFVK